MKTIYTIQDREAGNYIDSFNTLAEAQKEIKKFERADKQHNAYTSDFYELMKYQAQQVADAEHFKNVYGKYRYEYENNI